MVKEKRKKEYFAFYRITTFKENILPCRKKRNPNQKDYFDSQEEDNPKTNETFRHAE